MRGKPARFLAIDGESVTEHIGTPEENHRFVMLCASDGSYVENAEGLSTVDCFEFLLELKRRYPSRTLVGFVFNYDINMMLKGMQADGSRDGCNKDSLEILWKDRATSLVLGNSIYEVEWIPTKFIRIRSDVTVDISDVFGFFQSSFLTALEGWNVPDIEGALDRIRTGKADRANFQVSDMPEMRAYCISECEMLVELCDRLQASLREAGLHVTKWIGAGAVGSALINKYNVLAHHVHDYTLAPELEEAVMYAYAGGRFEMYRQGRFNQCANYDIISAYPFECLSLPSLLGTWDRRKRYDATEPYALWLVEWDLPDGRKVMPFPVRHKGNMYYPFQGKGWYWSKEVAAALAMHPEIKVLHGYVFKPLSSDMPFAFLTEIWEKRKEAKRLGLASQMSYKLGMNSLYGKLAQGRGYRGQVPKQRSFVWAGMITSGTRARLLDMMLGQEDNVIAVATDGVFYEEDPSLPTGNELGELEVSIIPEFYQLLNGIYYSPNAKIRTRGHSPKEIDWDNLTAIWDESKFEGVYNYDTRRFIGLGQALLRKDFSVWATWMLTDRKVLLSQHFRKYLSEDGMRQFEANEFENDNYSWYPLTLDGIKLGEKYTPKTDVTSRQNPKEKDAILDYISNWEYLDQPTVAIEG
jgi:hypothetical protein